MNESQKLIMYEIGFNDAMKLQSAKPSVFGKCLICCDTSTGHHYGVATCEGCKGFFKRTLIKEEKYRCYFGKNCSVAFDSRSKCKACRFAKCVEVGMSMEGIRMGRIKTLEKQRLISLNTTTTSHHCVSPLKPSVGTVERARPPSPISTLIKALNNDDTTLNLFNSKIHSLYQQHNGKIVEMWLHAHTLITAGVALPANDRDNVWSGVIMHIKIEIELMFDFYRETPGINDFYASEDFSVIMNEHLFEFYILRHACLFINGECFIFFPNGSQYSKKWMTALVGDEDTERTFEFTERFNGLQLTDREKALVFPFTLTINEHFWKWFPDFARLHVYYMKALTYEMRCNNRSASFLLDFHQVIELLLKMNCLKKSCSSP